MLSRAAFAFIVLFWLCMNAWLWRTEFGSRGPEAGRVPVELVWRKVLTSPDSSTLRILQGGANIGFCHCTTSVGEQWANVSEEDLPAGPPLRSRWYQFRLEGNARWPQLTNRIRFESAIKTDGLYHWQEFTGQLGLQALALEFHALAAEQSLTLALEEGTARVQRTLTFAELRNPAMLLSGLAGFGVTEALGETGLLLPPPASGSPGAVEPVWLAREDTLRMGQADLRVYRVEGRYLDRYQVVILVSRVGEILRVELPGGVLLVNDQLAVL